MYVFVIARLALARTLTRQRDSHTQSLDKSLLFHLDGVLKDVDLLLKAVRLCVHAEFGIAVFILELLQRLLSFL